MSRLTRRVTAAALAAMLGTSLAGSPSFANHKFSERTIAGTWTLFVQGFVSAPGGLGPLPQGTPLVAIATVSFDGLGGCRSIDQIVAGGIRVPADPEFFRISSDCSYLVNADGTGFFEVTFPEQALNGGVIPESTTTASFVIRDRDKMSFIADNTDIGIFGGGEMQRQRGVRF